MFNFAGNLMNLAANKNEKNGFTFSLPKTKKSSSHMSEYLNKNKSQKSGSFNGASLKLPNLFGKVMNSKK